jgi:hypothetical protein
VRPVSRDQLLMPAQERRGLLYRNRFDVSRADRLVSEDERQARPSGRVRAISDGVSHVATEVCTRQATAPSAKSERASCAAAALAPDDEGSAG